MAPSDRGAVFAARRETNDVARRRAKNGRCRRRREFQDGYLALILRRAWAPKIFGFQTVADRIRDFYLQPNLVSRRPAADFRDGQKRDERISPGRTSALYIRLSPNVSNGAVIDAVDEELGLWRARVSYGRGVGAGGSRHRA
jgi:hypothetical protein